MYEAFYGLSALPFEQTCNPKFVFQTPRYRDALRRLEDGILSTSPLAVLLGEPGTGKTTLLHALLASERSRQVQCVFLENPAMGQQELIDTLIAEFGPAPTSEPASLDALRAVLEERRERGLLTAVVIDEAERLEDDILDDLCRLTAPASSDGTLLSLVLAGHVSLGARLDQPRFRAVTGRSWRRCQLTPLDLAQTASLIVCRLRAAGGRAEELFTREAVTLVHEFAGGIPRTISVICDNALVSGFYKGRKPVTRDIVHEVCGHLDVRTIGRMVVDTKPTPKPAVPSTAPA